MGGGAVAVVRYVRAAAYTPPGAQEGRGGWAETDSPGRMPGAGRATNSGEGPDRVMRLHGLQLSWPQQATGVG